MTVKLAERPGLVDLAALLPDGTDRAFVRSLLRRAEVRMISEREDTGNGTHSGRTFGRRIAAVRALREAIPE